MPSNVVEQESQVASITGLDFLSSQVEFPGLKFSITGWREGTSVRRAFDAGISFEKFPRGRNNIFGAEGYRGVLGRRGAEESGGEGGV
jgi:hypothetical protein